jgi:putative redox protein
MNTVVWRENLTFDATSSTGAKIVLDAYPEDGKVGLGPTPLENLLISIAGCMAMDVLSILEKKRQKVTGYRLEIDGDRPEPGTWPRPYTAIRIRHIVEGEGVELEAVNRAIQLSDEKYCSVLATLRAGATVTHAAQIS